MGYLQKRLKYILLLSQLFGILPVYGIYSDDPTKLRFSWISWRVGYTLFLSCGSLFTLCMAFYNLCMSDFDVSNLTTFMFFFNGFTVSVLFLKLAKDWPEFMCYWQNTEKFIRSKMVLPKFFVALPFVILTAAAVEHGLFLTQCIISEDYNTNSTLSIYENFMSRDLYVFNYVPFTLYLGIFLRFTSIMNTFYWNFMDVFIILMSIAFASMLTLINNRIRYSNENKNLVWADIRRQYNKVCELSIQLEDKISPIILLSFSSNLYFVLIQLHGSVAKRNTILESVYFFYSFGLLLLRTLAVCLFIAKIDDENKTTLKLLSCLKTFNPESKRLLQQIGTTSMALSGMNFFSVTRGLILNTYGIFLQKLSATETFASNNLSFSLQGQNGNLVDVHNIICPNPYSLPENIAAAIVTYEIFFIQYLNTSP